MNLVNKKYMVLFCAILSIACIKTASNPLGIIKSISKDEYDGNSITLYGYTLNWLGDENKLYRRLKKCGNDITIYDNKCLEVASDGTSVKFQLNGLDICPSGCFTAVCRTGSDDCTEFSSCDAIYKAKMSSHYLHKSLDLSVKSSNLLNDQESSEPSCEPTSEPSYEPSEQPSAEPTSEPSCEPSSEPSSEPPTLNIIGAKSPTIPPTRLPSSVPSKKPVSAKPSRPPSHQPTRGPSLGPSPKPTVQPSFTPTAPPTYVPSIRPSRSPTLRPTRSPTVVPTRKPSPSPSLAPSARPNPSPSVRPSWSPSARPTRSPTARPQAASVYCPAAPDGSRVRCAGCQYCPDGSLCTSCR